MLTLCTRILRDPRGLVAEADTPDGLTRLTGPLLVISALGLGVFGAVIGSYHGGVQTAYAALKMPLLLLLPLLVCLPAVRALYAARGVDVPWPRLALAGLVGAARTAVLAAAALPAVWLFFSLYPGYHDAILFLVGVLAVVGPPGLYVIAASLPEGGRLRILASTGSLVLLVGVSAQTGWLLRPFVVREHAAVTLFRPVESDVFSALLATTITSAGGDAAWEPEGRGLLGRRDRSAP